MISVLMTTYNAEKYVAETIESVLKQTYRDFEFLIIDDGSTDKTLEVIRNFKDKRIKIHEREHDFIGSLNFGLEKAEGEYIARMDADDLMHPDRLRIQHATMEAEPSIDICSSWMIPFGETVKKGGICSSINGELEYPILLLLKNNLFFHPTMCFRRSFFQKHGLHYENYPHAEDYKLWFEAAKCGACFYVDSQPLHYYRISDGQVSMIKRKEQKETALKIKKEITDYLIERTEEVQVIKEYYQALCHLCDKDLLTMTAIYSSMFILFYNNQRLLDRLSK